MRTLKRFGQHWLGDPAYLDRICAAAELDPDEVVLEIGPGTGNLTTRLLALSPVIAVEIDRRLAGGLRDRFARNPRFRLIEGDILQIPLPEEPRVVVANIPYNITGPILARLLGRVSAPNRQFNRIVLLVQKELAERITAPPGSRTYGALSVRLQYLADCKLLFPIPARAFQPPPEVDSALIRIEPRPFELAAGNLERFESLVTRAFATRRKMLKNCLKGWVDETELSEALIELGHSKETRAEMLPVKHLVALANRLTPQPPLH